MDYLKKLNPIVLILLALVAYFYLWPMVSARVSSMRGGGA